MQDFKEEKKLLKYWYCTFSTLHQLLNPELQELNKKYLAYIEEVIKQLNSQDPTLDYQWILGLYQLNLEVFNNFLKMVLKKTCISL